MLRTAVISLMLTEKLGAKAAAPRIGDVQSLNVLPGIVLCAFAGIIADKFDKRKILNITAILSIVQALMLIHLSWTGAANASVQYVMWVMVFTGLTNAFDGVTRNSMIKDVTIDPLNQRTGSRCFTALYTLGMIVGQGCAGYIVDWFGYPCSYTLNLLSFIVLMIGLARIDLSHLTKKVDHTVSELKLSLWGLFVRDIKIGWAQISQKRALRICIYTSALLTVFGFTYNFMLPVIVKDALHGNNKNYSQLAMVGGFGSLAGALLAI
jgi:MFS family permease